MNPITKAINNNYIFGFVSLVIFLLTQYIAAFDRGLLIVFAIIEYCAIVFYSLKYRKTAKPSVTISLIIAPVVILLTPIHIISFKYTLISLPGYFAFLLGATFGAAIYFSKKSHRIWLCAVLLLIDLFMFFKGIDLWHNKIVYGTFFLALKEPVPSDTILKNDEGATINLAENKNMLVLDFWNTGCGVCFEKFPVLQEKYLRYKNYRNLKIYAVNAPLKRDTAKQGTAVFKSLKYSTDNLTIVDGRILHDLAVLYFPTVLIIYKGHVIYRGDIEHIDKFVQLAK